MDCKFNASEIFDIAITIEENGKEFYKAAAEFAENEDAKSTLTSLADMEDNHKQTFEKMKAQFSGENEQSLTFDPEGLATAYLQAVAGGLVFDTDEKPVDFARQNKSYKEILRKAIQLEKDSIAYYMGIKDCVPENLGREKIDEIIREEMRHINMLAAALKMKID